MAWGSVILIFTQAQFICFEMMLQGIYPKELEAGT